MLRPFCIRFRLLHLLRLFENEFKKIIQLVTTAYSIQKNALFTHG